MRHEGRFTMRDAALADATGMRETVESRDLAGRRSRLADLFDMRLEGSPSGRSPRRSWAGGLQVRRQCAGRGLGRRTTHGGC